MIVPDQMKCSLDHAVGLAKDALAGRDQQAVRNSLYVSIQVLAHIINTLDATNLDILDDLNDDLKPHQLKLSRAPCLK